MSAKINQTLKKIDENQEEIEQTFEENTKLIFDKINNINSSIRLIMCKNLAANATPQQPSAVEPVKGGDAGGKIRVGRIRGRMEKGKKYPVTDGYLNVVVTSHNQTKLGATLSPYRLADERGWLMENLWQFAKIYEEVTQQKQKEWAWPAETHIGGSGDDEEPTDDYWKWRAAGMKHPKPVRYPNGFKGRAKCLYALWPTSGKMSDVTNPKAAMDKFGYIESRKKIYAPLYIEMAKRAPEFKQLQEMLEEGYNLQILDVDGPDVRPRGEDEEIVEPYASMEPGIHGVTSGVGSIEINKKNIQLLLEDPLQPFGHGYCLAAALLGKEVEWGLVE